MSLVCVPCLAMIHFLNQIQRPIIFAKGYTRQRANCIRQDQTGAKTVCGRAITLSPSTRMILAQSSLSSRELLESKI